MATTIVDRDFRTWEVYATTGDYGFAEPARIVFHCTSDPRIRARSVKIEGDHADAERLVATAGEDRLHGLFERAEALP